jgi:hypothetical protein
LRREQDEKWSLVAQLRLCNQELWQLVGIRRSYIVLPES